MNRLIYFMIALLLLSCSSKNNTDKSISYKTGRSTIPSDSICKLNENISLLGNIVSFDFINKTHFVVSTSNPSNVFIYDIKGVQVNQINRVGRGPFEYIDPNIVRTYDDKIYVWCAGKLKLIVYDIEGNQLKEYSNFKRAIKNFEIFRNHIYFYISGSFSKSIIEMYDINTNEFIHSWGTFSNEDELLNMSNHSGGLSLHNSNILFASSSKLSVNKIETDNYISNLNTIEDKEFKVKTIEVEATSLINSNREEAIDYTLKNSLVTGLYSTEHNIVLTTEMGEYTTDGLEIKDFSNRYNKIYILDLNMKIIATRNTQIDSDVCLYSTFEDNLYSISLNIKDKPVRYSYHLNKLNIKEIISSKTSL